MKAENRKLFIKESSEGQFDLKGFGIDFAGKDGRQLFHLVVETRNRSVLLEFPGMTVFDLFTKVDLNSSAYLQNQISVPQFIKIKAEPREVIIEARSGTLYDFFKERGANGNCVIRSSLPVSFYWSGAEDERAA